MHMGSVILAILPEMKLSIAHPEILLIEIKDGFSIRIGFMITSRCNKGYSSPSSAFMIRSDIVSTEPSPLTVIKLPCS